jgi:Domain of unknown function (DUF4384)
MKSSFFACVILLVLTTVGFASQLIITEAEGTACTGDDRSRKETELLARKEAIRRAAENAATHIKSETNIKNALMESDLINAYANAKVTVLQDIEKRWYKDPSSGDCFFTKLKTEVLPDQSEIAKVVEKIPVDTPSAPLNVKVWTDRKQYKEGQLVKIYLKANKPFHGRVVYEDASGKIVQLLPNPYRTENYFQGGTVYELPDANDHFSLEVSPPFGGERVTVYASTSPLGGIETTPAGGVFEVTGKPHDVEVGTRGVTIVTKRRDAATVSSSAEFAESVAELSTIK